MADEKLVAILKQGAEAWNRWREDNEPSEIDLREARLDWAKLSGADLYRADLRGVSLYAADLGGANFSQADLRGANLRGGQLEWANLHAADLSGADLRGAKFHCANLYEANLSRTDLLGAKLSEANLSNANLEGARCCGTNFVEVDLSTTFGLASIIHHGLSILNVGTLFHSRGKIPEVFLRGCGVAESLIAALPSLIDNTTPYYYCFISYSHADKDFAQRLHDSLQGKGIRCWLNEHHRNIGDMLQPTSLEDRGVYDKIVLCCSKTSLISPEGEIAFNQVIMMEKDHQRLLIVPLDLDGYLLGDECKGWVADELRQRVVADFKGWKDHDVFEAALTHVVNALRQDGGKPPPPEPKLKHRPRT